MDDICFSKYNIVEKTNGTAYIVNTLSGALIRLDEETYKENFENNEKDNIRIYGYTYTTTKDVKKIAIDTYNEMYELKGDEALTVADFSNYFGSVYMNMTDNLSNETGICDMLGFIAFITGMVMLIAYFIKAKKYKKYFKKC